jgi:DNA repair protein RecO (recombination protein O)
MLAGALRTLAADPSPVVSAAFFWKLLSLEGFHPVLESCARCAGPLEPDRAVVAFDLGDGGMLCQSCGRLTGRQVDAGAIAVVALMVGGQLRQVLADPPPPAVLAEVERLGIAALEYHSERRIRSAALL